MEYKRKVSSGAPDHYYLKVVLVGDAKVAENLTPIKIKTVVHHSLQTTHGECGRALSFDVLKCCEKKKEIIIRVPKRGLTKVWNAISLCNNLDGRPCAMVVKQMSGNLLAMSVNSRDMVLT